MTTEQLPATSDEDLLNDALDCIYEIRGSYMFELDPQYARHREKFHDLDRVTKSIEKRLGRNHD